MSKSLLSRVIRVQVVRSGSVSRHQTGSAQLTQSRAPRCRPRPRPRPILGLPPERFRACMRGEPIAPRKGRVVRQKAIGCPPHRAALRPRHRTERQKSGRRRPRAAVVGPIPECPGESLKIRIRAPGISTNASAMESARANPSLIPDR